jgi:hypothetical protein
MGDEVTSIEIESAFGGNVIEIEADDWRDLRLVALI